MARSLLYVVSFCCCLWFVNAGVKRPYYRAAVYEHRRLGSPVPDLASFIESNLHYHSKAAAVARSKEADVIVFPEYGIFTPEATRTQLKAHLEYIPDPHTGRINPCEAPDLYSDRPIIYTLSCMARKNSIVVVANTGDIQYCLGEDECPPDGVFVFNTNVVFDRDGTLILKYHKEHMIFDTGMDPARKQQDTTFSTDFGTFATYISFDILFPRMGEVGRRPEVDAILFSTRWFDTFPQFMSVQFWQSWALGNDVTLLAANIQLPGQYAVGSGIFYGQKGALAYTFNPDGISKLVVANVPRKGFPSVPPNASITAIEETKNWEMHNDGDAVPFQCSRTLLNDATNIYSVYRCLEGNMDKYTFVRLSEPSGHADACNNGMCCSLDYKTINGFGGENFYLAVFNGTYNAYDRNLWCEENCVLARCDAHEGMPCAIFPLKSKTMFLDVYMRAKFSNDIVYSQVVGSGMRLVPLNDWHLHSEDVDHDPHHLHPHFENMHHHYGYRIGERSVHFQNKSGSSLISLGMKGRCYEEDPSILYKLRSYDE